MIWRLGTQFLVEDGRAFAIVDPSGTIVGWYGTRQYSDEDDLWTWTHVVVGDTLHARTIVEHGGMPAEIREDKVVARGLVPVEEPEIRAFCATVLGDDEVVREEARLTAEREAAAALDRIPGVRDDFGLGPDLARAQLALGRRVQRWGDELAGRLLGTAITVGRARPPVPLVTAFARACLCASFDGDPPALVPGEPVALPELARELAKLATLLDELADHQENVDAHGNARAYRQAADALREAARLAGGG